MTSCREESALNRILSIRCEVAKPEKRQLSTMSLRFRDFSRAIKKTNVNNILKLNADTFWREGFAGNQTLNAFRSVKNGVIRSEELDAWSEVGGFRIFSKVSVHEYQLLDSLSLRTYCISFCTCFFHILCVSTACNSYLGMREATIF